MTRCGSRDVSLELFSREPRVSGASACGRSRPSMGAFRRLCRLWLGGLLGAAALVALPTTALANKVHEEVVALLTMVERCGCDFNRNGDWYSAPDARKLLEHKYKAMLTSSDGVKSAEHFIETAASRSSMSGKPYLVRCSPAAAVPTNGWMHTKLSEMRTAPAQPPRARP